MSIFIENYYSIIALTNAVLEIDVSDLFTFTSAGLDSEAFRILCFTGIEDISGCYGFDLKLLALKEFDIRALYKTDAMFTVSRQDGTTTCYHGRVASVEVERVMSGEYFKCSVRLVPHLWFYTLRKSSKVYVGKTISQIIDIELKENGGDASGCFITQFDQLPQTPFPLVIKYHETPLDFISRLLQRECLYYYFLTEERTDVLKFSSDSKLSSNETISARPIAELAFSALGVEDERILSKSVNMTQVGRAEPVTLYAYDGNPDSVETLHGVGRTVVEQKMLDPLRDVSNIRQGQDSRKPLRYTMATSLRGVRVGIVHEGLRALSLRHEGDQSSSVLEALGLATDPTQQDFYRNEGIWIPEGDAYIPEWTLETPRIANATLTGFTTRINDNGTYDVRCHSIDAGTDLPNVRMMFPFAGQQGEASGLHFPLVDGTEVLLEFLEGDPDRPVILGSLYNASVNTPVTALNRQSHILETPQGQKFYLIDGENKLHLEGQNRIETLSQSELLEVDSTQAHIRGHSTNLVSFHADGRTQMSLDGTGDKVNLQAGDSVKMDMDHGGALVNIAAQATSSNIDGPKDSVSLNTGAGANVGVSGSANTIRLNTQGGATLNMFGGPGIAHMKTGGGQEARLSNAADRGIMKTSGGAQVELKGTKTTVTDGAGQSIEMVDGGNANIKLQNAVITLANAQITADNVNVQNKVTVMVNQSDSATVNTACKTATNMAPVTCSNLCPKFAIKPIEVDLSFYAAGWGPADISTSVGKIEIDVWKNRAAGVSIVLGAHYRRQTFDHTERHVASKNIFMFKNTV